MLIKFKDIVSIYGIPKGIIHIGAHFMEERNDYLDYGLNNTIWIEANTSIYSNLQKYTLYQNERIYNFAIYNESDKIMEFNITNNGESSSLLKLDKHKIHHPHIHVVGTSQVRTMRMDDLIKNENIDLQNYNFVNLDIQGVELLALQGFGDYINNVDYIYTEVNTAPLYEGCCLIDEIDSYLSNFGFVRALTNITEFEWGDALYVKNN